MVGPRIAAGSSSRYVRPIGLTVAAFDFRICKTGCAGTGPILDRTEQNGTISRRCVFFIGGYEPKTPNAFFERLEREKRYFEATWDVQTSMTEISLPSADVGKATFVTVSKADGWQTTTEFYFLGLDSIVTADAARPLPVRVFRYLVGFFDYWLTGTAFSIFAKSWRFGLYFLYPFVVTVLFFLLAYMASSAALRLAGLDLPGAAALIALLAVFPLLATLGRRWSVTHLLDLWSFSREYVRGRRPEAEALLERHAAVAAEATAAGQFDEILFIGHSTGGGLILDMAARTLEAAPDLARRAPEVTLLTLGSTALKFGLHPSGTAYRKRVQRLADEAPLQWSEFQCLTDVINFYKTNPLRDMGLTPGSHASAFPIVRKVHLRDMLGDAAYAHVRGRFFRVHYQFISANRQPYYYDFFQICFGPFPTSAMHNGPNINVFPDREAAQ